MLTFIINIIALLLCGALIGYERVKHHKVIGIRTCILIMLGAFIFTYLGINIGGDPSRVAAQVASGVGFIGAGIIFKNGTDIQNITTAVLVWCLAALGAMIGIGLLWQSLIITVIIYGILQLDHIK